MVGLRVADACESTLPAGSSPFVLQDPEGGGSGVFAGGKRARAAYERAWAAARSEVAAAFRAADCDLVDLDTGRSAFAALELFFRERRRRIHG